MSDGPGVPHLRSLTSLRFAAAMLVVIFHLALYAPSLDVLSRVSSIGYVGVTFFFVLSGFVLTFSWDKHSGARNFYRRRFARIYPVHVLFIIVAMVALGASTNWSALPANALLLQAWSHEDSVVRSFSGVSWSLSCEAFFYTVFPLLVLPLSRVRRPWALAGGLLSGAFLVGALVQWWRLEAGLYLFHLPAFRLVEFVVGALAARAMMRGWTPRLTVPWATVFVVISYLTALVLPVVIGSRVEDRWVYSLLVVPGFALLISACAANDLHGRRSLLQASPFVTLGQWSFAIYMCHAVVLGLARPLLGAADPVAAALASALVVAVIIALSGSIYVIYERPLERRLRRTTEARVSDLPSRSRASVAPEAPSMSARVAS